MKFHWKQFCCLTEVLWQTFIPTILWPSQCMTLSFSIYLGSKGIYSYITDFISFWKMHCFHVSTYKTQSIKFGQGQYRVIIWTNMLQPKSIGSKILKKILRFLPSMGMVAFLLMWPGPFEGFLIPLV